MAIKLDKVLGRVREQDEHKCGIEVSCMVPNITLEMQLRKYTDVAVYNRHDKNGNRIGTDIKLRPAQYDVKHRMRGEWVIYLRYFGDASTLDDPKIGILHKSKHYKMSQKVNDTFGMADEEDADVEVYVQQRESKGWVLLCEHSNEAKPILFNLPAAEGVWEPLMQVDEFVEQFLNDGGIYQKFKHSLQCIGGETKLSSIDSQEGMRRAVFQRVGLTIVSNRITVDGEGVPRKFYTHHSPLYFTMKYCPRSDTPMEIII